MKVCIFSGVLHATTFIERLINGLANQGIDVLVVGKNKGWPPQKHARVQLVPIDRGMKGKLQLMSRFVQALLTRNSDVLKFKNHVGAWPWSNKKAWKTWQNHLPVFIHQPDIFHLQWAIGTADYFYLKSIFNAKFIVSLRGAHINYTPICNTGMAEQYRQFFPKVDAFHAVSKAIGKEATLYGANPEKIKVIYSGLALHEFAFQPEKEINKNRPFKIISIGRDHWKKGYRYAIDAVAELIQKGYRIEYTIIGGLTTELKHQIHQLNLSNHIVLKDRIPFAEVKVAMAHADILLLPSVEEGIANVVLEAMALGTVVVSSNCGGMEEAIQHGISGYIFPIRNVQAMVQCIEEAMNLHPEAYHAMTQKARTYIEQNHTIEKLVNDMVQLYQSV